GRSWLSFARGSKDLKDAAGSLRYEYDEGYGSDSESGFEEFSRKPAAGQYAGKSYNSVESVQEFFRRRDQKLGGRSSSSSQSQGARPQPRSSSSAPNTQASSSFVPGSYVRHSKYGR